MLKLPTFILLLSISQFIYGQRPVIIFSIEKGIENDKEIYLNCLNINKLKTTKRHQADHLK